MKSPTILILTGEVSGDDWGAGLASQLKKKFPRSCLLGIGGSLMKAQGVKLIADIDQLSLMGLGGVITKLPFLFNLRRKVLDVLRDQEVDLIVAIDFAGFNMSVIKAAYQKGVKVVYYVAPKVWAWGAGRTKNLVQSTDHIAVIFPFEEQLFTDAGGKATFVGHPLVDHEFPSQDDRSDFCETWNLDPDRPILALCPGSRPREIARHLDLFVHTGQKVIERFPEMQLAIARSRSIPRAKLWKDQIPLVDEGRRLLAHSRTGLLKSGTVTLEACLAGTPFLTVYRTDPLTFFVAKKLLKTRYLSIPNVIEKKCIVPEILQGDATLEHLVERLIPLLKVESAEYQEMSSRFQVVKRKLGRVGVAERVSGIISSVLEL